MQKEEFSYGIYKMTNPKFFFLAAFVFSTYCLFSAFYSISILFPECLKKHEFYMQQRYSIRSFKDEILLEHQPRLFDCTVQKKNEACAQGKVVN